MEKSFLGVIVIYPERRIITPAAAATRVAIPGIRLRRSGGAEYIQASA